MKRRCARSRRSRTRGRGRSYVYALIKAEEVAGRLSANADKTLPKPETEWQMRPLTKIKDADARARVWAGLGTIVPKTWFAEVVAWAC
jgi:hypothetical protein